MYSAVEGGLLWYSAPTSLSKDLLNDDVILEIYNKMNNMTVKTSFTCPVTRTHTTNIFFLEAQRSVLMIYADEWARRLEREENVGNLEEDLTICRKRKTMNRK